MTPATQSGRERQGKFNAAYVGKGMCDRAISALTGNPESAREAVSITWFLGVLECYRLDDFQGIRYGGQRYFAKLDTGHLRDAMRAAHHAIAPARDAQSFCGTMIAAVEAFRHGRPLTVAQRAAIDSTVPFLEDLRSRLAEPASELSGRPNPSTEPAKAP